MKESARAVRIRGRLTALHATSDSADSGFAALGLAEAAIRGGVASARANLRAIESDETRGEFERRLRAWLE